MLLLQQIFHKCLAKEKHLRAFSTNSKRTSNNIWLPAKEPGSADESKLGWWMTLIYQSAYISNSLAKKTADQKITGSVCRAVGLLYFVKQKEADLIISWLHEQHSATQSREKQKLS